MWFTMRKKVTKDTKSKWNSRIKPHSIGLLDAHIKSSFKWSRQSKIQDRYSSISAKNVPKYTEKLRAHTIYGWNWIYIYKKNKSNASQNAFSIEWNQSHARWTHITLFVVDPKVSTWTNPINNTSRSLGCLHMKIISLSVSINNPRRKY